MANKTTGWIAGDAGNYHWPARYARSGKRWLRISQEQNDGKFDVILLSREQIEALCEFMGCKDGAAWRAKLQPKTKHGKDAPDGPR